MSTWSPQAAWFARGVCLMVCLASFPVRGQNPATPPAPVREPAPAPKQKPAPAPKREPVSPSDAAPKKVPAATPAEQPKVDTAAPVVLPPFDLSRLAHPNVADQLELTDEQRAGVAQLINERAQALAAATPDKRAEILASTDQKLAALLNEGQRAKLAALAETQKLRFNFRFQKWDDVLDWFARQAGLALVMDQPPPGPFTYSDNRAYTPTEAIDLLNSVLLTKGFTLIQRGRMLILVDLSKDLPLNLIPRVPPEEIAQRGNFEFISVLLPLGRRPADGVAKEIQPLMSKYGTCVGLPQTGQLLLTETAGKLKAISILVASIPEPQQPRPPEPKPAPPPPVLVVYPVTTIDPAAAVKTLEVLFPNAKFKIDDKADQIMAYATPAEQTAIKGAVDQMQANRPPETQPRLEIYPLNNLPTAATTDLLKQLQAVLPNVRATVDATLGRLLVFAEPKDQEQVKAIMQKLGADTDEGGKQVVVYQPKHFDPAALATLVKQLIPRAEISSDPKLRRVVVSASAASQAMVKSLVEQLDQESALEDTPLLQLYPLEKKLDDTVLTLLRPMVPDAQLSLSVDGRQLTAVARVVDQTVIKKLIDQWKELAAAREEPTLTIYPLTVKLAAADMATLKALVPAAETTLSTDGRQLRVVARTADHQQLKKLISQLEEAATAEDKRELALYPLGRPLNPTVLTTLSSLVPGAQVSMSADAEQLIVVARPEEQAVIKKTLDQISVSVDSAKNPTLEFYSLSDETMSTSVTAVLANMAPTARVTWDVETRRLMVVATPKDQQVVRQTIEQVTKDAPPAERQVLQLYPLDVAQRTRFQAVQTDLMQRFPGMRVIEDPQTGELAIWAKASQHVKLAELFNSLGATSEATQQLVLISYPIREGSAKTAFEMLKQLYPTLKLTLDEKSHRVLVYAPLSQHSRIKQAIGQVDVEVAPNNKEELRSYSTGNVNPTSLVAMLQKLLPEMQITPDLPAQKIIAWGTVADHAVLAKALEQFRTGDPAQRPTVMVYPVEGRTADGLAQLRSVLLQVVPEAVIGIDARGGAIVASAREADHKAIRAAIDQVVAMDREAELRLESYTLDKIKSAQALTMLRLIAPTAQMSVGAVPEQIVVWASAEDHQRIQAALVKLEETGGTDTSRELRVHQIRKAASTQAVSMIATALPDLQVLAGQGTDRLLIWGSAKDHARLDELIQQLEKELHLDVEREIKTFELKDVDPAEARRVLDAEVGNLEYVTSTIPGRLVIRVEPTRIELIEKVLSELQQAVAAPEQVVRVHRYDVDELNVATVYSALSTSDMKGLSIQVNPTTNSLIVRGPAARQDELAATLSQLALQLPAPDKPVAEVYRLQRADANAATVVVRSLVPTAVVAADVTNQTLAVTATTKDHDKIKAIVAQLDSSEGGELVTETYVLKRAYPSSIMTAVKPIVPRAIISPDAYSKTLIVTATAEDHKKIKAIIDKADGLGEGELSTKAYALQWVSPYAIMTALTPIVPTATFSPDAASKTLIVTANDNDHKRVAAVIEQSDQRGGGEWTTQAYALKWANAATVSVALTSVVPDAKVSSDTVNKMLIVTASAKDHAKIQAVLDQADKRGGGGELVTKAYRLQTANPSTVMTAITPVVPNATISADPTNRMLVVTASEEDHVRIKTIIDEADRRQDGELITEVYALKWANPIALSYSIKPIAPTAVVSPDVYNKTLIVSATAKDHARIKPVIDQADMRGGGDLVTAAYPLKWANASTISVALTSVVPDAKVSSDPTNKMIIVTASQEDQKRIQAVLEQADKRGGGGELATKAYTLQTANPSTIMTALLPVVPNATVSSDPTNRMLVVTASEEDHLRIKAIIDEADRRQDGELTTEVYSLKWANPMALSYSIKPIAPNAVVSPDVYNKTLIVTATAKDHARIKPVIDQADMRGGGEMTTTAYTLKWANASTISTALTSVVPDAKVSSDPANKMLIVTASKEDHAKIQAVLEQADKRGGGELATKAYTLRTANPATIMAALRPVVPDAKISSDVTNQMLIVTASEEDHLRIKTIVDEADRRTDGELLTEVYRLKWANPTALSSSIKPISPQAIVSPDVYNKTVIVTATAKDHARIKSIVEQADRRGEGELATKVYAFKLANPATVAAALTTLLPNATMSSDRTTNTLIVTASAVDHKLIEPLVRQLDMADPKASVLKPYKVENADPQQVYRSLTELFRTSRNINVGYQQETGMILVFASAADQEEVARAITDIDKATAGRPKATLEVYSLEGLDGDAAVDTLRALLVNETPKVDLQVDLTNNQILAIAEPSQHELLRKALSQLSPEQREVEVFPLQRVDPFTAQSAISTLFTDLPLAATPSVEADSNTQQLMVRATKSQLERIRQLLKKMGEGPVQPRGGQSGSMLRILPLTGDVESALRQIERIWPQVRGNPIQVIVPPKSKRNDDLPRDERSPKREENRQTPPTDSAGPPSSTAPDETAPDDNGKSAQIAATTAMFVSAQIAPAPPAQDPVPDESADGASTGQSAEVPQTPDDEQAKPGDEPSKLPPIVVIAGEGRITVASRDPAALDEFENLLKTLQRGRRVRIETGNYSMFLLQNADAKQLAEVIQELFRRGPRPGGDTPYRPSFRRSTNLTVVADTRMNALLVYGSSADRDAIEKMLDVLDSMDNPDSLATPRPQMIQVKNLPASTIVEVLKTVYKSQLTARTGVRPMTIPQGLSFEMTSMLQLINAAAEAPLLTLDIDLTTNSIVMRAPRQLGKEIEEFVTQLDEQAKDGGKRSISLVPLKSMSSKQVQDALRMLIPGGRMRRRQ